MLVIRKEQIDALQQAANRRFARKIRQAIRMEFLAEKPVFTDSDLEEYLAATLARAQRYGLKNDNELVTFIGLTLTVSRDFDRHGIFHDILNDARIPDAERLDVIFEKAKAKDWEAAGEREDLGV